MKATTILVSALATLVAAAPAAEKKVEERAFNFDVNSFNNFNGFQSVNLNYLAKFNGIDLNILSLLAGNNNFNIGGFQNLFAIDQNQFNIQDILLLQQLFDLQQFFNAGILNNFNLGNFQFGGLAGLGFGGGILDTGLLNLGGVGLGSFVNPSVVTQVQTVAQSFLPVGGVLGGGVGGGLNSGAFSGGISSPIISSGLSSGLSSGASSGAVSSAPSTGVVTAAEQEAQEGGSSLNRA